MDYTTARANLKQARIERDQLKAALARVLKACDHAELGYHGAGVWISTAEIRAAAIPEGITMPIDPNTPIPPLPPSAEAKYQAWLADQEERMGDGYGGGR